MSACDPSRKRSGHRSSRDNVVIFAGAEEQSWFSRPCSAKLPSFSDATPANRHLGQVNAATLYSPTSAIVYTKYQIKLFSIMVSIPLITSIPPRMSRLDAKGDEIGEAYQLGCIESWRRSGFEPVSVNSKNEAFRHALRMIPVSRDASAITGRPHVFLADLLAVASIEAQGRQFVLMNGDLVLPRAAALAARVAQLHPGEFIFSRRIDISRPDQTDGMPHRSGYDFFAGHADDISGLRTLAWCSVPLGGITSFRF